MDREGQVLGAEGTWVNAVAEVGNGEMGIQVE